MLSKKVEPGLAVYCVVISGQAPMGMLVGAVIAAHANSIGTVRGRYIWQGLNAGFITSSKGFGDWDEEER